MEESPPFKKVEEKSVEASYIESKEETKLIDLNDLSPEKIREHWIDYAARIPIDSPLYSTLWETWAKKFNVNLEDPMVSLCRRFIESFMTATEKETAKTTSNSSATAHETTAKTQEGKATPPAVASSISHEMKSGENPLIIKGMDGFRRLKAHQLCDILGLHHQSVQAQKKKKKHMQAKNMHLRRPENWSWEFSFQNPYSNNPDFYQRQSAECTTSRHEKRSMDKCCDGCGASGTLLLGNCHIHELYCEDCIEVVSDGDGGLLSDHKFEPMY